MSGEVPLGFDTGQAFPAEDFVAEGFPLADDDMPFYAAPEMPLDEEGTPSPFAEDRVSSIFACVGGAAGGAAKYLAAGEVKRMLSDDKAQFMFSIKGTLEEVHGGVRDGSLLRNLKVPIFGSPVACPQNVPGYPALWPNGDAGCFDPAVPGATYVVWTDGGVLSTDNKAAVWRLNPSSKQSEKPALDGVPGLCKLPCACPAAKEGGAAPDFRVPFTPNKFRLSDLPTVKDELRSWLREELERSGQGLPLPQLQLRWESAHPDQKFPTMQALGWSKSKGLLKLLETWQDVVAINNPGTANVTLVPSSSPQGTKQKDPPERLYLICNMDSKRDPTGPPKKKRKHLGPGESAPGKITIAWVNDFLLELGLDQTEDHQKRVQESYMAWWKGLAFRLTSNQQESQGAWPDYVWRYFNQDEKRLEGEDETTAKNRKHQLVEEILHSYVEHARSDNKLLGLRSAEEIEESGIDAEKELRGVVATCEVFLQFLAMHAEKLEDQSDKIQRLEDHVHRREDLCAMTRPWCKTKGFQACLAYAKLDLKRGWTLGFEKKWLRASKAPSFEVNNMAANLFRAFRETDRNFEMKLRQDVWAISAQYPDWRTEVGKMRDEALKLAREETFSRSPGGWFRQLCKAFDEYAPYKKSIEDSEAAAVSKASLPLRKYQGELVDKSRRANSVVFCATGTGKTKVACERMKEVLQAKGSGKVVVLVETIPLLEQQILAIRAELSNGFGERVYGREVLVRGYCGAKMALGNNDFLALLARQDVIVVVPEYLLSLLEKLHGSLAQIDLLVLDECHHCSKEHKYMQVLRQYKNLPKDGGRPIVIGLTASLPSADSVVEAKFQILDLLLDMGDANLVSVVDNLEELAQNQTSVEERHTWVQISAEEHWLEDSINVLRSKVENAGEVQELRPKIQSRLSDAETLLAECGVRQALSVLAENLLELYVAAVAAGSEGASEWIIENLIVGRSGLKLFDQVFENPNASSSTEKPLESASAGPGGGKGVGTRGSEPQGGRKERTPVFTYDHQGLIVAAKAQRLEKLHEILQEIQREFTLKSGPGAKDFRGIVFVKTRQSVREILDRIRGDALLSAFFRPEPFVGQVCMTIGEQQEATLRFRSGECNLLVATSVAEEGLDFPACNVVVRYSSASSHTALIQSRGRVRAEHGTMFVLTRSDPHSSEYKAFRKSQRHEGFAKDAAKLLAQK